MATGSQKALEDAITLIADLTAKKGYVLNRVKLAKLLYFLDLQAWKDTGRLLTGVEWRWMNHGPYSEAIVAATDRMQNNGELAVTAMDNYYGNTEYRIRSQSAVYFNTPSDDIVALAEKIVEEYGTHTATALKELSYKSDPMLYVQEFGQRGDILEFPARVPSRNAVQRAIARYALLARNTEGTDKGDVAAALREDMAALDAARSSANRLLLDDK